MATFASILDENVLINQRLICRSCSLPKSEEKMKNLNTELTIDATIFEIPPNTTVLDLFTYCTKLPIQLDDRMPQNVCTGCIRKLLTVYEFLRECDATEDRLRAEARAVAERRVLDYVGELNFDDIILLDVKEEAKSADTGLSEEEAANEEAIEKFEGHEFLTDPSSLGAPDEPAEEYLDPEYLDDDVSDTQNLDHIPENPPESLQPSQPKTKIFRCSLDGCEKEFRLNRSLRAHQEKVHTTSFLCPVCGLDFPNRRGLSDHERSHDGFNEKSKRRADCKVCGISITVKDMKVHLRRHTGERPYTCSTCGKTFRQCSTLRTHELIHLKQRPFPCNMCEKTFARAAILKIHYRSHTGEKPFACASCPNKYSRRHLLTNHERKHTGSKPYGCEICGKRFKNLAFMKEHRYSHEANQLKCEMCEAVFTYPRLLRKHVREQHLEPEQEIS